MNTPDNLLTRLRPYEPWLFAVLMLWYLVPVWSVGYFLTGDGPCHVYNAKVVNDYFSNINWDFYNPFYLFNTTLVPNWWSHFCLAVLLNWLPDHLAEKIFLTIYLLLFGIGARKLVMAIRPESAFVSYFLLAFAYHSFFMMGFYNFSSGFAFFFIATWYWWKYRHKLGHWQVLMLSLLFLLTYFAHPVGLVMTVFTIGCALIIDGRQHSIAAWIQSAWQRGLPVLIALLPVMVLFGGYMLYRGGFQAGGTPAEMSTLWERFSEMRGVAGISNAERPWVQVIPIVGALLLVYTLVDKIRRRSFGPTDAFFLCFLMLMYAYFLGPADMMGAGLMGWRLQFTPYFCLLLWVGSAHYPGWARAALTTIGVVIAFSLIVIRLPYHQKASRTVEELLTVRDYIDDRSTVLPLSYDFAGQTPEGEKVTDYAWLFLHAADYIGSDKSLIMMGNYEGGTFNFPLIWRWERNPYNYLGTDKGGIESLPPHVNILDYPNRTGGTNIDYVLLFCPKCEFRDHDNLKDVYRQLNERYDLIFTTKTGLGELYKRK